MTRLLVYLVTIAPVLAVLSTIVVSVVTGISVAVRQYRRAGIPVAQPRA